MLTSAQVYGLTVWIVAAALILVIGFHAYRLGKSQGTRVVKTEIYSSTPITQREKDITRARSITRDLVIYLRMKHDTDIHTRKQSDTIKYVIRQCEEIDHFLTDEKQRKLDEKLRKY